MRLWGLTPPPRPRGGRATPTGGFAAFLKGFAGKSLQSVFLAGQVKSLLLTQKGEVFSLFEGKIGKMKIFLTTAFGRVLGRFWGVLLGFVNFK